MSELATLHVDLAQARRRIAELERDRDGYKSAYRGMADSCREYKEERNEAWFARTSLTFERDRLAADNVALREALTEIKELLLSAKVVPDPDTTQYLLDGGAMYHALNKARTALALVVAEQDAKQEAGDAKTN